MTADEIDRFIASQHDVLIVAMPASGPPEAAMGRLHRRDPQMSVDVDAADPVVALLGADDRVCLTFEQFPSYYEIKGVMLHGRARRCDTDTSPGVSSFDFALDKTVSFDFGKLAEADDR